MTREKQIETLARKLYEARHPSPEWPSWDDLQVVKTYKRGKYCQLAEVAIIYLCDSSDPKPPPS